MKIFHILLILSSTACSPLLSVPSAEEVSSDPLSEREERKPKREQILVESGVCSAGSDPGLGIVNGTPLAKQSPVSRHLVRVISRSRMPTVNGADRISTSLCTGTLLDDRTVLTAAHCVHESDEAEDIRISFGGDPYCESSPEEVRIQSARVLGFIVHRSYSFQSSINDIALIRLEEPSPEDSEPTTLFDLPQTAIPLDAKVLAVGFGKITGADEVSDPNQRLRYGWIRPLKNLRPKAYMVDYLKSRKNLSLQDSLKFDSYFLVFDQTDENGICIGDSGGPTFIKQDGQWRQVGVSSFVFRYEGKMETCRGVSAHVNLHSYTQWLRAARAELPSVSGKQYF